MTQDGLSTPIAAGAVVGFIGLGRMGVPMASRLLAAGYDVRAYDNSPEARRRFESLAPGRTVESASSVAHDAAAVILMLPDTLAVRTVIDTMEFLDAVDDKALVIDMGSSNPIETRQLASRLELASKELIDAPVSGGVAGAELGKLTVMVGGTETQYRVCDPLLSNVGDQRFHVGPVGSGHALKALNNLLSATSLLATAEALKIGRTFGLEVATMLEALNRSSGRSYSTEVKFPNFVVSETFDSGFSMRLMAKDVATALSMAVPLGISPLVAPSVVEAWTRATTECPPDADHTEIAAWFDTVSALPVDGRGETV